VAPFQSTSSHHTSTHPASAGSHPDSEPWLWADTAGLGVSGSPAPMLTTSPVTWAGRGLCEPDGPHHFVCTEIPIQQEKKHGLDTYPGGLLGGGQTPRRGQHQPAIAETARSLHRQDIWLPVRPKSTPRVVTPVLSSASRPLQGPHQFPGKRAMHGFCFLEYSRRENALSTSPRKPSCSCDKHNVQLVRAPRGCTADAWRCQACQKGLISKTAVETDGFAKVYRAGMGR